MQFFNRQVNMVEKKEKVFSLNAAEQKVHYQFTLCNKKWRVWTKNVQINRNYMKKHEETRMHSSRMHTVCCSGCLYCHGPPPHTSPCHACPLPPMRFLAMHTHPLPCKPHSPRMPPSRHMPPFTTHTPLHHVCPPVCGILDTCLWKHYLSATTVADGNKTKTKKNKFVNI